MFALFSLKMEMDFSLKRFVIEMMFYFWKRGVGPALQGFVQALVPSVLALPKTFIPLLVLVLVPC